jgi:hypothetical protein
LAKGVPDFPKGHEGQAEYCHRFCQAEIKTNFFANFEITLGFLFLD